jgi:hypothetical protein
VGTRPAAGDVPELWYVARASGEVYMLGAADVIDGKPSRIYNILGPDYTVPVKQAYQCTGLGVLSPGMHNNTAALAVLVNATQGKAHVDCRLGRLYGHPTALSGSADQLHFVPCGAPHNEARIVRAAQVAQLKTMSQGMREACLRHGQAPGYEAPQHLQSAHAATAAGRADVRETAEAATRACAAHFAVLRKAVQAALASIEAGTSKQQRKTLEHVREELKHTEDTEDTEGTEGLKVPAACINSVNEFVKRAEPAVCLAEANDALIAEGLPPIPQGANAEEDMLHMRRKAKQLAKMHVSSEAVGILQHCTGKSVVPSHGRTNLDIACGRIPIIARMLQAVHKAPPGQRPKAVQEMLDALRAAPPDRVHADCQTAAERYLEASHGERCLMLIKGKPGQDQAQAAINFLNDVERGRHEVDCETYECLKRIDAEQGTMTAKRALEAASGIKAGQPLMRAVREACHKNHSRLLKDAEAHMTGDDQWLALLQGAQEKGEQGEPCVEAVEHYIVGVNEAQQEALEECDEQPAPKAAARPPRSAAPAERNEQPAPKAAAKTQPAPMAAPPRKAAPAKRDEQPAPKAAVKTPPAPMAAPPRKAAPAERDEQPAPKAAPVYPAAGPEWRPQAGQRLGRKGVAWHSGPDMPDPGVLWKQAKYQQETSTERQHAKKAPEAPRRSRSRSR